MEYGKHIEFCNRCGDLECHETARDLEGIAYSSDTYIEEIYEQLDKHKELKEKAQQQLNARKEKLAECEQQLTQCEEELSFNAVKHLIRAEEVDQAPCAMSADWIRQQLEQEIEFLKGHSEDIELSDVVAALNEYEQQGLVEVHEGKVVVTSRGARVVARQALKRIMDKLTKKESGSYQVADLGFGTQLSLNSRPYDFGDRYELVDIERTLANAMNRSGRLSLQAEDFHVFDTQHQTGLCFGLLIDESGSMQRDRNVEAATEVSLALSELIRMNPKDKLEMFIFSDKVQRISPWDIVNKRMGRGSTDMRAALTAFRMVAMRQRGDKQAYLITDTEPNTEDGEYIGFDKAMAGVMHEALKYRENGITLNIIMLSQRVLLIEFARTLAQKNLGRVFFTDPRNLGALVIGDYLKNKRNIHPI